MKYFQLKNKFTNELTGMMSLNMILNEINRDRSHLWVDYDESDFKEGLEYFTEYVIFREVEL